MPPTKKTVGLRDLRVGLLIVGSILVLIFLILNASGDINPFKRKLHLRARFADANGLRPGSDVKLAGVRIGKVDDVRLLSLADTVSGARVEAKLSVDGKIDGLPATERIRTDSKAQQGSTSLLGNDQIINITAGTAAGDPIRENAILDSTSANSINDLATSGTDLTQRLGKLTDQMNDIVRNIKEGRGSVGLLFNDEALYNNLNGAIRETDNLIGQIRSGNGSAGKFINDPEIYNNANAIALQLKRISEDITSARGSAGKFIEDPELYNRVNAIADRVDRSVDQINSIIVDVRAGRGTFGKLITDEAIYNDARAAIARLNSTSERVDNIISSAQRGEGTVGKLLTDDQLYSNVNQLSSEGVKLVYDFRQNPKKYLTIKFQLF